jgi:hypothetical protein
MFFDRLFSFLVYSDCELHHFSDEDVRSGIFQASNGVTITGEGQGNIGLCLLLLKIEQGGSIVCSDRDVGICGFMLSIIAFCRLLQQ